MSRPGRPVQSRLDFGRLVLNGMQVMVFALLGQQFLVGACSINLPWSSTIMKSAVVAITDCP